MMNTKEELTPLMSTMRAAVRRPVSQFTKFIQNDKKKLHCFFEGEDQKYYRPRILKKIGIDESDILVYPCEGKKDVLKTLELIKKGNIDESVFTLFFVDLDFDFDHCYNDADLYCTPCYSIENFYTTPEAFGKVLHGEYALNYCDPDFVKCTDEYKKRSDEFYKETVILNSWIYYQKKHNECEKPMRKYLNNWKITKAFNKIKIDEISLKEKIDLTYLADQSKEPFEVEEEVFKSVVEKISQSNYQQMFRGKFSEDFMKKILEDLIDKNKKCKYFSETKKCVNLNPHINFLSAFSLYADTPKCLDEFLDKFEKRWKNRKLKTISF